MYQTILILIVVLFKLLDPPFDVNVVRSIIHLNRTLLHNFQSFNALIQLVHLRLVIVLEYFYRVFLGLNSLSKCVNFRGLGLLLLG